MQMRKQMEILIEEMLDGQILLNEAMSEFEKLFIEKALERNNDHISKTAFVLGIHRNTVSKRLAQYENDGKRKKNLKRMAQKKAGWIRYTGSK